jgi:virginiamycin B lyase
LKKLQTADARPYGIAINSKGIPFFCEFGTNKMAKIDPQTMAITEYKLPESARPRRMAIDARDNIYFTDFQSENLGRLDPATGAVKCGLSLADRAPTPTESPSRRMAWFGTANLE